MQYAAGKQETAQGIQSVGVALRSLDEAQKLATGQVGSTLAQLEALNTRLLAVETDPN